MYFLSIGFTIFIFYYTFIIVRNFIMKKYLLPMPPSNSTSFQ